MLGRHEIIRHVALFYGILVCFNELILKEIYFSKFF